MPWESCYLSGATIIQGQVFLELERFEDQKLVYIDPSHVVAIEPGYVADCANIRLYSLGGIVSVMGHEAEISAMVCKAREMVNQITMGALVAYIKAELKKKEETIN